MHERIHKSPADGGIEDLRLTLKRRGGFTHHERRTGHGFDATGDQQIAIPGLNGARRKAKGIQTGAAQAVNGGTGNGLRQTGQQRRHARHVAVILSGLICAAEDHVIYALQIELRVTRQQRTQRNGP
ncbi:Uncharacterised protein [Enterobacter hormaechei]|nr:Uncharacterised protein [Enterobacter hormaechei]